MRSTLERQDDAVLLRRRDPAKEIGLLDARAQRLFAQRGKLRPAEQSLHRDRELSADVLGYLLIVAGEDLDAYSTAFQGRDRGTCAFLGRVQECGETGKHKIALVGHGNGPLSKWLLSQASRRVG